MKLTVLLLTTAFLNVHAGSAGQSVTFSGKSVPLKTVFSSVKQQTGYVVFYSSKNLLSSANPVSLVVENMPLKDFLDLLLKDQPFIYEIDGKTISLFRKVAVTLPDRMAAGDLLSPPPPARISGVVRSSTGEVLSGASVRVRNSGLGTTTSSQGVFTLGNIPENAVLEISMVGYDPLEIGIRSSKEGYLAYTLDKAQSERLTVTPGSDLYLTISLKLSNSRLDDIVVVGYGSVKRGDLTGAIQQVSTTQFENQTATNVLEYLNGTVAGFNSNQGTTASGGGSSEIRGPSSLKASTTPLIVLDGVIYNGNLSDINPNDIANINILKDASSAAIFGSKSAAGVMIITTKKGKTAKPTINFTTKLGIVGLTNILRSFNASEYLTAREYALAGENPNLPKYYFTNPDKLPSSVSLDEWMHYDATPGNDPKRVYANRLTLFDIETENYLAGKTTDWYGEFFRNGLRQDYDLSLSGGTSDIRYFWSADYTYNKGAYVGDEFKSVRSRLNVDADITRFLKVGVNAHFSNRDESREPASLDNLWRQSPFGEMYNSDGTLKMRPHDDQVAINPFIYSTYRQGFNKTQSLFANLFSELKLPLGFSYRVSYINRYVWNNYFLFDPIETPRGYDRNGYAERQHSMVHEWMVDNILAWNKRIGIHNFDVTFLMNAQKYQSWSDEMENSNFSPTHALIYHSLQTGTVPSISSDDQYKTENALMGRLNYSLLDKYLLTLTYRRDGNSTFGNSNPYAGFFSSAAAWWISREKFFNSGNINELKLRASWGETGNSAIGFYDALARLSTTQYLYGTTQAVGVYNSSMANSDLRWETTTSINLGIDFGLFKNRINGSIDVYQMKTTNLLLERSLPNIIGYSSVSANLGELGNRGFELTLNTKNIRIPDKLDWSTGLVFSFNRNKINHLYGEMIDVLDESGNVTGQKEADDRTNNWFIGQSIDRIWDYDVIGVWQIGEEAEAARYNKVPGDHKLRDVNDNGSILPLEDKVFLGYSKPQYRLGLRNDFTLFRNFSLSFFIRADLGFFSQNNQMYFQNRSLNRHNFYKIEYWTPDNPSNTHARLWGNYGTPSYNYYESRAFVRLQDVSFSYSVPTHRIENLKMQNLRLFLSLRNALTFTSWSGWDPESGYSPMPKFVTFGVNIQL